MDELEDTNDASFEIIDIDSINNSLKDEETWLISSPNSNIPEARKPVSEWISGDLDAGQFTPASKKSLVNKLEIIAKGSPMRFSSSSSSYSSKSPPRLNFLSRLNNSSTPVSKVPPTGGLSGFDSRTFSRSSASRTLLMNTTFGLNDDSMDDFLMSPIKFNQTSSFYKISSPQLLSSTYDRDVSPGSNVCLNETFDRRSFTRPGLMNAIFDKDISPIPGQSNATFRKDERSPPIGLNQIGDAGVDSTYLKDDAFVLNDTYKKESSAVNVTFNKDAVNATFNKDTINATFSKDAMKMTFHKDNSVISNGVNNTFDLQTSSGLASANETFEIRPQAIVNSTFEVRNQVGVNSTFVTRQSNDGGRKLSEDRLSSTSSNFSNHRLSRDSSHDLIDEDRLSTASESSASHRLNDVGDVQHIARLQEEILRQPIILPNLRSATISPSSEHSANSPSTEGYMTGNNFGYQSEEGGAEKGAIGGGHQYSSQDSLPDSPYSSQSLDVQPLSEQDRLRRSMPNLNKIRGQSARGGGAMGGLGRGAIGSGVPQRPVYGALSRQHTSDPRLQAGSSRLRFQGPPSRGTIVSSEHSLAPPRYGSSNTIQQQGRQYLGAQAPNQAGWGQTMIAQPKTGIPRPGSRIPGPRTISGIPKPGGAGSSAAYSQPGSRASSIGPRKMSATDNYYY